MKRLGIVLAVLLWSASATPSRANWAAGNHTLVDLGSAALSGSGYSSAPGAAGASCGATSYESTNGSTTNGGANYRVERIYTNTGGRSQRNIVVSLTIDGHSTAFGLTGGGAGGYARSKSYGDPTLYPDNTPQDLDCTANYPAGPTGPSYSSDNSGEVAANKTTPITMTITLKGYIWAYASTNVNTMGVGTAEANSTLSFADPDP